MEFDKYQLEHNGLYFKHELSLNLPSSTYAKHTHNMYELLYFISGDATQIIEDRRHKLKSGELVLIPPQKYHFVKIDSPSDYERYDILFDDKVLNIEGLSRFAEGADVINLNGVPMARDILEKTDFYYQKLETDDFVKVMTCLLNELFYVLRLSSHKLETESFVVTTPTLSKAICYINDNLATLSGVEEVAKACFVSKSYLFRLFKRELHQSPKKYITDKRLLMAQSKIVEGEKPMAAYTACGFSDYTVFYRNYIDFFGYRPSETREKVKKRRTNK